MKIPLPRFSILLLIVFSSLSQAALPIFDSSGQQLPTLAPMLKQVNPAVVNISTFTTRQVNNPLMNDPFFKRFFNSPNQQHRQRPQRRQNSAGSGVIVDKDQGLVVTNYHVIAKADEVHVGLVDGRSFKATVLGSDPELDVAVLKIDADGLTEVNLANSGKLEVGDFVVAIGNPFGLGQTVTTGIVSALGRTGLGIEGYENFIQTDASINPGNSGGALVNLRGELVGINTAIISPAGGNVGIGFAIPINMVKTSMDQLVVHGEVKRGHIGVSIQDISSELRKLFELDNGQQGVLISGVSKKSPAEKGGLKDGDVIIAVDGETTVSSGKLRSQIGMRSIGDEVEIAVIRDDREKLFKVKIGESQTMSKLNKRLHQLLDGSRFEDNPDGGVLVAGLAPNSAAAHSGLRVGDVLMGANRQAIKSVKEFKKALKKSHDSILLHVSRGGRAFYLVLR
ncbi:MAG: Do/DeqQ family serine protease [Pseudohongiellaceae bacterium]|jgi:Do/DeqQ family serine protease